MTYTNLYKIAERFCGAILFDGEGNAMVVKAKDCFSFDKLVSTGPDDEVIKFEDELNPDFNKFYFKDLPSNVIDIKEIKRIVTNKISTLSKAQKRRLLEELQASIDTTN